MPQVPTRLHGSFQNSDSSYPNRLITEKVPGQTKTLGQTILDATDLEKSTTRSSINDIRKLIKTALAQRSTQPARREKIAIRRMMSSYWENSSLFSIDLVGAVIRQGSFIQKMHSINWINSPTVRSTVERLIRKYERYFRTLALHPNQVAVPTLDVDLAWRKYKGYSGSLESLTDDRYTSTKPSHLLRLCSCKNFDLH